MDSQGNLDNQKGTRSNLVAIFVIRSLILIAIMLAVFGLSAGTINWWQAWVYTVITVVTLIGGRLVLLFVDPERIEERIEASRKENVMPWDRPLVNFLAIYGPVIAWIVAGLDYRFGWSPELPLYVYLISLAVIICGSILGTWPTLINRFFSSHVRIQSNRDHTVVSEGPYRLMRQPGYAGAVLVWIATPLFFSSYWMAIPTLLVIGAYILRTSLEDRHLQENLQGYREYAEKVRYRLLPGIW